MAAGRTVENAAASNKLHGRAFYESIGSPKYIVAPMVDQSEFAWRMLTRSFLPEPKRRSILAYSPMFHARLFSETETYRDSHFQPTATADRKQGSEAIGKVPWLDGNPAIDRPLFVQFCANDPQHLLTAAKLAAPHCDAVDLNLGCPQCIARKGRYGAFLQEDQDLIHRLIKTLHEELPVPVTAKIRILETAEATLAYAQNVLSAGASILTVHGRRRAQKGHWTGLADLGVIRYLRDHLPKDTVLFANGNILQHRDLQPCLEATGADGVMSAEGNLSDPAIFAPVPEPEQRTREYWVGRDGKGGWRVDAIMRRYLDILHKYALGREPPERRPLFVPGDDEAWSLDDKDADGNEAAASRHRHICLAPANKRKRDKTGPAPAKDSSGKSDSPNLAAVQAHLFHLLRHLLTRHTDVRALLAKARSGDLGVLEKMLETVERRCARGMVEYDETGGQSWEEEERLQTEMETAKRKGHSAGKEGGGQGGHEGENDETESSMRAVRACKCPWWVAQPIVRPLPKEAMAMGAIQAKTKRSGDSCAVTGIQEDM